MSRKARNGKAYKFTKKRHSGKGVAALALSFVPLILFFYAVAYSFMEGGGPFGDRDVTDVHKRGWKRECH